MRYEVRVLSHGHLKTITLDAEHDEDLQRQLEGRGVEVVSTKALSSGGGAKRFPLLLFTQELQALMFAGLGLVEALEGVAAKEQRPEVKAVYMGLLEALYRGQSFSSALELYPSAFPQLFAAMIRASERTGDLGEAMRRYVGYEKQVDVLRKKLVSASIYPALLLLVGGLVILFLLGYVVPRFSQIYADMGKNKSLMLQFVMMWSGVVRDYGNFMLILAGSALVTMGYALSQGAVRARLTEFMWRIPVVGEQMRTFQLARFYRTLSMLMQGGIPVSQALEMAKGLLSTAFHGGLTEANALIREGRTISEALEMAGLVTPISLRMLRVGEKSGEMGRMMEHIATLHDEEISRWLDWVTKLVEPLLMLFIGGVIGIVVLMLYMPIFELAGSVQ